MQPSTSLYLGLTGVFLGVWVIRRLQADTKQSAAGEAFQKRYVIQALRDKKTYIASTSFKLKTRKQSPNRNMVSQWHCIWDCEPWLQGILGDFPTKYITFSLSDGPLYAFSLFLPTIINQVSRQVYFSYFSSSH